MYRHCFQPIGQCVHHNTAHLDQPSCLLLTQTASAHLLAAVQPIISLPPFLCSRSNLGHVQGREGAGEEARKRGGLLSSDIVIKESPPQGWARPLSVCRLAPRHGVVHTHCCLQS